MQAGVDQARFAISSVGGPGVVITGPTLVENSRSLIGTTTQTDRIVTNTAVNKTFETAVGPGSIKIGDRGLCTATGCSGGTVLVLNFGEYVNNTNTNTHQDITETTSTTETWQTREHYELTGQVQAVGMIHGALQSAAFDAGSRFLARLGEESAMSPAGQEGTIAPVAYATLPTRKGQPAAIIAEPKPEPGYDRSRLRLWAEGYGGYAKAGAERGQPGEERRSRGLAAGFNLLALPGLTLGLGVDHGTTDVKLSDGYEWGDVRLTQLGFNARYELGGFFAAGGLSYGFGEAKTTRIFGGYSAGSYDLSQFGVRAEAGYRFQFGDTRIVPSLGLDHLSLKRDGFVEQGAFALFAPGHTARRTRGFLGLEIGHGWASPAGAFDLSAYARLVNVFSGKERGRPASFVIAPNVALAVRGLDEAKSGLDLGAKAALRLTTGAELFARYDGRFRDGFTAYAGSAGLKLLF